MPDQFVVTVADDHLQGIDALATQLRAVGMQVEQILPTIGVITGSITPDRRPRVAEIPGVASVDEQTTYQLPPPDAEIQ